jgi:hypothetical protein
MPLKFDLPTDSLSVGTFVLATLAHVVDWTDGALKIVVANDSALSPEVQTVLTLLLDALNEVKSVLTKQ